MSTHRQISSVTYKLTKSQHRYLIAGLREYTWDKAHPQFSLGRPLSEMPIVKLYDKHAKVSLKKGLLALAKHSPDHNAYKRWYSLGPLGLRIVMYWSRLGYDYNSLAKGHLPPRENIERS